MARAILVRSMQIRDVVAGRFVVERRLGSGGMGSVFAATDRVDGGQVAVKVLDLNAPDALERFRREARVLSELSHPGIVRYIAHGMTEERQPFFAMELLEGEDLAQRLDRDGLTVEESLALARRAAAALSFAHASGVIHRDIKPSNLFLVGKEVARVKVLDFGIARAHSQSRRLTQSGALLGTVGYMAPEQAMGERDVDARADVFSLGCVLFECLTGRAAFAADNIRAILAKVLVEQAPSIRELRPELGEGLDSLVTRMLAKRREDRPEDAAEVLRLLEAATVHGSGPLLLAPKTLTHSERRVVSAILAEFVGDTTDGRTAVRNEAREVIDRGRAGAGRLRAE
jgi:serine/threonine protein kinase